jgi:hypothetical protein
LRAWRCCIFGVESDGPSRQRLRRGGGQPGHGGHGPRAAGRLFTRRPWC